MLELHVGSNTWCVYLQRSPQMQMKYLLSLAVQQQRSINDLASLKTPPLYRNAQDSLKHRPAFIAFLSDHVTMTIGTVESCFDMKYTEDARGILLRRKF